MALRPWLRTLFRPQARRPAVRPRTRPCLEILEDRMAPAVLTVLNASDHDPGSLRAIIAAASSGDRIVFDSALDGQTITLTSGELLLTKSVTITGPTHGLTIDAHVASRIFETTTDATISGLTLKRGNASDGGAIFNVGNLSLTDCTLWGNWAGDGRGGGIYNRRMVTLTDCTLVDNYGGTLTGIGGGLYNDGTATLTNCTLLGNIASLDSNAVGGGIYNAFHCSVWLNNSIVAYSSGGDVIGLLNGSHNLIGDGIGLGLVDTLRGNPLLGPLQDNGGPTQTRALLPGSPALGAGSVSLIPTGVNTDQRGAPRLTNGAVDIGAFESRGFTLTTRGDTQIAPVNAAFGEPLQVTVTANDPGVSVKGGVVIFSAPASGASAALGAPSVTLDDSGVAATTAVAGDVIGTYQVTASAGGNNVASFTLNNAAAVPVFSGLLSPTIVYGTATTTLSGRLHGHLPPDASAPRQQHDSPPAAQPKPSDSEPGANSPATGKDSPPAAQPKPSDPEPGANSPATGNDSPPAAPPQLSGQKPGADSPATGEVSITINGLTKTVSLDAGGNFSLAFPTATLGVAGQPYTVTYSYAGGGLFAAASNSDTTLTVASAPLTITPSAGQSQVLGSATPVLTYTAEGFVNGESASLLTGSLGTTATPISPVGAYAFTLGTLKAGPNYTLALAGNAPTLAVISMPLTAEEHWVQALYLDCLGRAGAKSELDQWVAVLNAPGGTRAAVAAGIQQSPEAADRLVKSWYVGYLGRPAVGGEELGWVNAVLAGWTEEQVLSGILASSEFYGRAQALAPSGTPTQRYAQVLYQVLLGRSANSVELAGWDAELAGLGRQRVALAFLQSDEFRTDQFEGYYAALLHRPADSAGLDAWVHSPLDMLASRIGFEVCPEFYSNG